MPKLLAATALALATGLAAAHSGHALADPHWHASDLFGPLMLVAVAAAVWCARKKR